MGMWIGVAVLAGVVVLAIYLLRAGHLSGPQGISRRMGGCCSAHGFEPSSRDTEKGSE